MSQIAILPPSGKNKLERWRGLLDAAFHLGSCPLSSALTLEKTPSRRAIKVSWSQDTVQYCYSTYYKLTE